MEERKWEELNIDCLVNVFGRVGMESLLLDVPFVCKSWHKATLSPLCWRRLIFPEFLPKHQWHNDAFTSRLIDEYGIENLCVTSFIKAVVKRCERSATVLALPSCCSEEALLYAADECPDLRSLLLPRYLPRDHMSKIPNLINKWKNLEFLSLKSSFKMQEVIAEISIHCKNFVGLAVTNAWIGNNEALAIVTHLPNIKSLYLIRASMEKANLVMILQGCKSLVYFDARKCVGFDEGDEEILKLASHVHEFKDEGSKLFDYHGNPRHYLTAGYQNTGSGFEMLMRRMTDIYEVANRVYMNRLSVTHEDLVTTLNWIRLNAYDALQSINCDYRVQHPRPPPDPSLPAYFLEADPSSSHVSTSSLYIPHNQFQT